MQFQLKDYRSGEILEINSDYFKKLSIAKESLLAILQIEERYEIVLSNYLKLEEGLFRKALTYFISNDFSHTSTTLERVEFNSQYANILTSIRMYLDQMDRDFKKTFPEIANPKEFRTREYENNLSYRFMEKLRSFVQHKDLPVHDVELKSGWKEEQFQIKVNIYCRKSELDFSKNLLQQLDDKIDLKLMMRAYVRSLSCIHQDVRKLVESRFNESASLMRKTISEFEKSSNKENGILMAIGDEEEIWINGKWEETINHFKQKNKQLLNLEKRIILN